MTSPQGIYTRLKTKMSNAYYSDNMVGNLANFRTEASTYLSGPGQYKNLTFLEICENLEGKGHIGWDKLDILKVCVKSAAKGETQLLDMINNAERKINESMSGEEMVVNMEKPVYQVKEGCTVFLDCSVAPEPMSVVWKKGGINKINQRILINNKRFYCAGPSSPALVIREAEKRDEAYYQCTARDIEIEVQGNAVPLEVDSNENKGSHIHGTQHQSNSATALEAGGAHSDRNSKSSNGSQNRHIQSGSCSQEDRLPAEQRRKEVAELHILMSSCEMKFTITNYHELEKAYSIIKYGFRAATGEERIEQLDLEKNCIRVRMKIEAANSLSDAPAVCLAEQFKRYMLDSGLHLSEEPYDILEVDGASIQITPEIMSENDIPLVHISQQEFSTSKSDSVILQTYIISSPPASSVEWFKINDEDSETLIEIDGKKYYGGCELSPSLIIRNVNVENQGWYICRATNTNGTGCSSKTFVRISIGPAGTEDNPETLVTQSSDIKESSEGDTSATAVKNTSRIEGPAGTEDNPGTLVTEISDIKEPTGKDTSATPVKETSPIKEPARAEDNLETLVTRISDTEEPVRAQDRLKTLVTQISDTEDSGRRGVLRRVRRVLLPVLLLPSEPRTMKVAHAGRTSLTVSWKPPLREGESPVTSYIVEKRTAWTQVAEVPADEISCVADNLIEGTEYGFRITAVNEYGKSPFLKSDQTYTPKSSYNSPLATTGSPYKADIGDIEGIIPIKVLDRVPSKAEIERIANTIDNKFSSLFLELGMPTQVIEDYGQGHPVTFKLRMGALLQCWTERFQAKPTIGRLLTAMKVCQMDWRTTAQIWSP